MKNAGSFPAFFYAASHRVNADAVDVSSFQLAPLAQYWRHPGHDHRPPSGATVSRTAPRRPVPI